MVKNLVLIGMPGAGKSTLGVLLAKTLGMSFIDTDLLIQERTGHLLQELINRDGVEQFLNIEEQVILGIGVENCVIATGGSVIYRPGAMAHLKKGGILVYLKLDFAEIEHRIDNMASRGIAIGQDQPLIELYHERITGYEKYADLIVDCTKTSIEQAVREVAFRFQTAHKSITGKPKESML